MQRGVVLPVECDRISSRPIFVRTKDKVLWLDGVESKRAGPNSCLYQMTKESTKN